MDPFNYGNLITNQYSSMSLLPRLNLGLHLIKLCSELELELRGGASRALRLSLLLCLLGQLLEDSPIVEGST